MRMSSPVHVYTITPRVCTLVLFIHYCISGQLSRRFVPEPIASERNGAQTSNFHGYVTMYAKTDHMSGKELTLVFTNTMPLVSL